MYETLFLFFEKTRTSSKCWANAYSLPLCAFWIGQRMPIGAIWFVLEFMLLEKLSIRSPRTVFVRCFQFSVAYDVMPFIGSFVCSMKCAK